MTESPPSAARPAPPAVSVTPAEPAAAAATPADPAGGPAGGPEPATLRGIGWMLLAMLLFATMDAASKTLVVDHSIAQILWVRYLMFLGFAMALAARRGGLRAATRSRRPWQQVARSLLLLAENAVFVLAFRYLPLADAHALAAVAPLLVTALSVPLLGERVGLRRWAAVATGFLGVLVIVRPGFATVDWTLLIPLFGALLFALYQIQVRQLRAHDSAETTLFYSAVVGAAVLTLVGPATWTPPDAAGWGLLLLVGVLGTGAHVALILGLASAPASTLQPYNYTLLLWAAVIGFLVFGDLPDLWTVAGGLVVAASGLYVFARERRRRAPPRA